MVLSPAGAAHRAVVAGALEQEGAALEIKIQIAVRGRDDALDAGNRADGRYEILSDGARRFTERPGELEGDRDREVTQCAVGWRFHRERWNLVY